MTGLDVAHVFALTARRLRQKIGRLHDYKARGLTLHYLEAQTWALVCTKV